MSVLNLPQAAEDTLSVLLADYARDRARWPLWTYERRDPLVVGVKASWLGEPWVERLRWSGLLPLLDIGRALADAVKGAGGRLITFSPHQPLVSWLRPLGPDRGGALVGSEDGDDHVDSSDGIHLEPASALVPLRLRMRSAALFSATAHPVPPTRVSNIAVPSDWSLTRLPLDDRDRADLGASAIHAMSQLPSAEGGHEGSPHLSLFLRCLTYEATSGEGRSARRAPKRSAKRAPTMSRLGRRRSLEREIASRMGLLPDRTGGRRIILERPMIRQLLAEATEIVAEVRRWQPSEGLLDHVSEADDQVEKDADNELTDNLAWARHRVSRHAPAEHGPIEPARAFRFPYLTLPEITMALEDRKESRVARVWVRSRLASDVVAKTLQNLLAQTPQATEVEADE